jgi:deoxyribodipyrimidine photo-lyase
MINSKRVRNLKKGRETEGHVLYWMSRDQRVYDNWALIHAIELAENEDQSVIVVFALSVSYPGATWRHYDFMLKGLKKVEEKLSRLNIPFYILIGDPVETVPFFIRQHRVSKLVVDFDPLKIKENWKKQIIGQVEIPVEEVDAHNIVPCWIASEKTEFSAFTIRPKIKKWLPEFMDEFPPIVRQRGTFYSHRINWEAISISVKTDHSVRPVEWLTPGEAGASVVFEQFLEQKLEKYAAKKNDPNEKFTSGLSPYLHFGHISAQRIALEITRNIPRNENTDSFLEELIIRKELSDNFCYYNPKYDQIDGVPAWARNTLNDHRDDIREHIYTSQEFEEGRTHDHLWNAAQQQMVSTGNMSGYLRMYWAKKILEWSESPEAALHTALYLNDKYQLDGRDPNGYAGCAWSIGGVHDRAWGERNVFGKVRYMNRSGCNRKFDVEKYISRNGKMMDKIK